MASIPEFGAPIIGNEILLMEWVLDWISVTKIYFVSSRKLKQQYWCWMRVKAKAEKVMATEHPAES